MKRKFLLLIAVIFALSFCTASFGATELIVKTNGTLSRTANFTEEIESEDITNDSGDVIGTNIIMYHYTLTTEPFEFSSINDALNFTNDPDSYFTDKFSPTASEDYSVGEVDLSDVEITLTNPITDGSVVFGNYSSLSSKTITINGNSQIISDLTGVDTTFFTFDSSATITVKDLTINGGSSVRGVDISNGTTVFDNVTFTACSADEGGAVLLEGGTTTFDGCKFTSNNANNGGAMRMNSGNITFSGTNTFSGNTATNGGAVYTALSSAPDFSGVTFNGTNTATNGGAVYIRTGGATFSSTTFNINSADNGGSLYVASGTVTIDSGTTITDSKAANGGIFYITGGTVNINAVLENHSASGNGGTVYISGGTVNISDNIENNTANNGGAIYMAGGTANINGTIDSNTASNNGGAFYVATGTLNISASGDIANNEAEVKGGAVYLGASRNARLNLNGDSTVTFRNNTAQTGGGAIYADTGSQMTFNTPVDFIENVAESGNGGALYLATSSQLMPGTVLFEKNSAQRPDGSDDTAIGNGGAIYIGATTASTVTLNSNNNYTFSNNHADCYGGAIYTMASDIIFDGFTVDIKNDAGLGGGFAASNTGRIEFRNSSTVSNQEALQGGAIYGGNITITSSDFSNNTSTGRSTPSGGGAIFAFGELVVRTSMFSNNTAVQDGGAILVQLGEGASNDYTVVIESSYFTTNRASAGNGGAVNLQNTSSLNLRYSTFVNNEAKTDGGAISIQGDQPDISYCYFRGNYADNRGGAIYFNQSAATNPDAFFKISYSMLDNNSASGNYGGGLCIISNGAAIDSCTFSNNQLVTTTGEGYGGGVYLDTTVNGEVVHNTIDNCTFTDNSISGGDSDNSGGGGLALYCERTTMRSCTFADNASAYKGGAIYVAEGRLIMSGTIAVGNATVGAYDIWVDSTIESGGYNRIGIYGQGRGVTDFYSIARQETDRTAFPSKNWTRETFFSSNTLDDNLRTDLGDDIPPKIGSVRAGQVRLQTLMLSEDVTLPLVDRATNIIPYSARQRFPDKDERGVNRRGSGSREIKIDIGAVYFDGTREAESGGENADYEVVSIQISGIPNYFKQIGQSATLIAKIYYANGRTGYGGTGDNEEPVKWTASGAGASSVTLDQNSGFLTLKKNLTTPMLLTITVETTRMSFDGDKPAGSQSKSFYIGGTSSGVSENSLNSVAVVGSYAYALKKTLIESFTSLTNGERYGYASVAKFVVESQTAQSIMNQVWGLSSASLITDFSDAIPEINSSSSSTTTQGFTVLQATAVAIKLNDVDEGEMMPLTYPCNLSGEDLKGILGSSLYENLASDLLIASDSESTITDETAQKIFSNLRVEFQDNNGKIWPVIGEGTNVDLIQALDCEALVLSADNDLSGGIHFDINTCIMNVLASDDASGPQLVGEEGQEILIIPDGINDSEISGTIWVAQKDSQTSTVKSQESEAQTKTESTTESKTETNSDSNKDSGGGGGGCEVFNLGMFLAAALIFTKKISS